MQMLCCVEREETSKRTAMSPCMNQVTATHADGAVSLEHVAL